MFLNLHSHSCTYVHKCSMIYLGCKKASHCCTWWRPGHSTDTIGRGCRCERGNQGWYVFMMVHIVCIYIVQTSLLYQVCILVFQVSAMFSTKENQILKLHFLFQNKIFSYSNQTFTDFFYHIIIIGHIRSIRDIL